MGNFSFEIDVCVHIYRSKDSTINFVSCVSGEKELEERIRIIVLSRPTGCTLFEPQLNAVHLDNKGQGGEERTFINYRLMRSPFTLSLSFKVAPRSLFLRILPSYLLLLLSFFFPFRVAARGNASRLIIRGTVLFN